MPDENSLLRYHSLGEPASLMQQMKSAQLIDAFEKGILGERDFSHTAHLEVAYYYLSQKPFLEACIAMRDGLLKFTARLGKSDLYNETMTIALMSLVQERRGLSCEASFDLFLKAHPELLDRKLLLRHYTLEEMNSDMARRLFLLPKNGGIFPVSS